MKLWDTLSPEEQRAVIIRDLDAAEASGVVEGDVTKDALIKTALDTLGHAS